MVYYTSVDRKDLTPLNRFVVQPVYTVVQQLTRFRQTAIRAGLLR